jgi:hypothetical protein
MLQLLSLLRGIMLNRILAIILCLAGFLAQSSGQALELRQVLDLGGRWKFELGDNAEWSKYELDDSGWDVVRVPSPWEEQGYPGYDGYAWYRKHFKVSSRFHDRPLYLRLGHIDDAGEVYLNGKMIGFVGIFPPNFYSGYGIDFRCPVPHDFLNDDGDNIIAVRVFDYKQAGGLTHGNVGFYQSTNSPEPDLDLSGQWKFKVGDSKAWAESSFDDSRWQVLRVPLLWDAQGYKDYDGYAWYRTKFKMPQNLVGKRLILLVGKIDDCDETYVNGQLVGKTGDMQHRIGKGEMTKEYQQLRAYTIPPSLLLEGKETTIAVRVLDVWMHGGIYEGPVGLIEKSHYTYPARRTNTFWDSLRNFLEHP